MEHSTEIFKAMMENPRRAVWALLTAIGFGAGGAVVPSLVKPHEDPAAIKQQVRTLLQKGEIDPRELADVLEKHAFFEVSAASDESEAILTAVRKLGEKHRLVNGLREMSMSNEGPFDSRSANVVFRHTSGIPEGVARVCHRSPHKGMFLQLNVGGADPLVTLKVEAQDLCDESNTDAVLRVGDEEWARLQPPPGAPEVQLMAREWLHMPYVPKYQGKPISTCGL